MKNIVRILGLGFIVLTLGACASSKITDFSNAKPPLVLADYFVGQTTATGVFEDRFGKMRRQFVVKLTGTVSGDTLTLDERFVYNDGETQTRIWKLTKTSQTTYEGRADDIIGVAKGVVAGNALNFKYDVNLKVGKNKDGSPKFWKVRFDDWMFLQPNGVLMNRAYVSRFGLNIGSVTIAFHRDK
jgi:Protein of unknown function (DUF3833)